MTHLSCYCFATYTLRQRASLYAKAVALNFMQGYERVPPKILSHHSVNDDITYAF